MLCNKESIILKDLVVHKNLIECDFSVSDGLKKYFSSTHMFIKYTDEVNLNMVPKSILVIPFVASFLPLAWLTDAIMWVEEIDKTFYQSLTRVKNAYQEMYDYYPLKGSLIPAKILENNYHEERESLVLFSGGIDAQTTYLRNLSSNPILFNIQGWYKENYSETNDVADKDIRDISTFCKKESKDFEYAKSNFATIINNNYFRKKIENKLGDSWWHGFQHSMAFISIAIPLCYFYKIKTIYIASSFSLGDEGRCASYPTTDSEFAFANIGNVIHDGFELSRQDKVKIIVEHQKKINKPYPIKVCTFNEENCLMCEKCVRTMLGIIAENGDIKNFGFNVRGNIKDHFLDVFNKNIVFFDVRGESKKHWKYIKTRMKQNYDNSDYKDVIDWFLNENLIEERKKRVLEYRIKNFTKLVQKKILKR